MPSKLNLSFAGCGFLGIYHVGVAVCFKKFAPHILLNKISGASAGAIAACCLLCDLPLGEITSDLLRVVGEARARTLGPFSPSFNVQEILMEGLQRFLPKDAHKRVNGKLHISLTRIYDGQNVIVSHFNSREDLLKALSASAFVPVFSGFIPPAFHGFRYMDGGFSDNLPTLDESTITVSPFCGESDICPRDLSLQLFHINVANTSIELSSQNIYRFTRILFPPKPEVLSNMCKQGFDDALRFLNRNNLINCNRCLAFQTTFMVQERIDEDYEYDPQCKECKIHRIAAMSSNLPDTVLSIFQEAIDSANKGLINWIFKHRTMRILSILTLPYTFPIDFMYAMFNKLVANAPILARNVYEISKFIMGELARLIKQLRGDCLGYCGSNCTKITCQLAITQYNSNSEDEWEPMSPTAFRNRLNFNFTLNLDKTAENDTSEPERVDGVNVPEEPSPEVTVSPMDTPVVDDDTFDHILQATAQHDSIMAYYYTDDDDNVKVNKVYDVPGENSEGSAKSHDEWTESMPEPWVPLRQSGVDDDTDGYDGDGSRLASSAESSNDDDVEPEACANVFSDPESEWTRKADTTQIQQPPVTLRHNKSRPESDQEARYSQRSSYIES